MIFFSCCKLYWGKALRYSWSAKINKVISDLLRLIICHKTI